MIAGLIGVTFAPALRGGADVTVGGGGALDIKGGSGAGAGARPIGPGVAPRRCDGSWAPSLLRRPKLAIVPYNSFDALASYRDVILPNIACNLANIPAGGFSIAARPVK